MDQARVKLTVSRVGNGFSQSPGHEIEVPVDEAFRLVDSGQAYFVGPTPRRPQPAPVESPAAEQLQVAELAEPVEAKKPFRKPKVN